MQKDYHVEHRLPQQIGRYDRLMKGDNGHRGVDTTKKWST